MLKKNITQQFRAQADECLPLPVTLLLPPDDLCDNREAKVVNHMRTIEFNSRKRLRALAPTSSSFALAHRKTPRTACQPKRWQSSASTTHIFRMYVCVPMMGASAMPCVMLCVCVCVGHNSSVLLRVARAFFDSDHHVCALSCWTQLCICVIVCALRSTWAISAIRRP